MLIGLTAASPAIAGSAGKPGPFAARSVAAGAVHLFAVSGREVGRFDVGPTGAVRRTAVSRGLSYPSRLTVDGRGNLYLVDGSADGTSRLIWISAAGVQRVLAPNLRHVGALVLDTRGNLVVGNGNDVVRITQPAGTQHVLGTVRAGNPSDGIEAIGLDAAGRPTAGFMNTDTTLTFATFPAAGGRLSSESSWDSQGLSLGDMNGIARMRETPAGSVLVDWSTFSSGYFFITRFRAGSIVDEDVPTRTAEYAWTFDAAGRVWFMQNRKFCNSPSIGDGSCDPDYSIDHILTGSAGGWTVPGHPRLPADPTARGYRRGLDRQYLCGRE